jgi:hypothetical protein
MGHDPADQPTPELFPTATVRDTSSTATISPAPDRTTDTAPQRHVLPKNLPNALKHLSDGELNLIYAATIEEIKRRGGMPQGIETDLKTLRNRLDVRPNWMNMRSAATKKRQDVDIAEVPLAQGKLNAVRAAFKAGVTPSRIARCLEYPNRMCGKHWRRMKRSGERYDDQGSSCGT